MWRRAEALGEEMWSLSALRAGAPSMATSIETCNGIIALSIACCGPIGAGGANRCCVCARNVQPLIDVPWPASSKAARYLWLLSSRIALRHGAGGRGEIDGVKPQGEISRNYQKSLSHTSEMAIFAL